MRAVAAQRAQVVAAEVELAGRQKLLGPLVGQEVPLELEEQQLRLDRRAELLRLLHQGAPRRVAGVERKGQQRVGTGPAGQVADLGQLVHGVGEPGGIELGHLAAVALGEGHGALARLVQQGLDALGPALLHERLKVPGGFLKGGVGGGAHPPRGYSERAATNSSFDILERLGTRSSWARS